MKTIKDQLLQSLSDIDSCNADQHRDIENALDKIEEVDKTLDADQLRGVLDEIKSLLTTARASSDELDPLLGEATEMLADGSLVEAESHTEHIFHALKHLGVKDLDLFTESDLKMALESTEGL